ncbi:hypothetical protein MMC06_003431 [Schaereria dolodes]|nr:hypothetical protein [Schaereria dolodes]
MAEEACCTCASLLSKISPQYDVKTEKPVAQDRRLDCCGRVICGKCISDNQRFATYCPFCQIASTPSSIPQGLREPPAYSPPPSPRPRYATLARPTSSDLPPPYATIHPPPAVSRSFLTDPSTQNDDTIHHLHPDDTISSISLAYRVPIPALRASNALYADHLLAARRTVLIPREYYQGDSLSPVSVVGEEEEERRSKVRRWMVGCKVADLPPKYRYDIALLYLKQADYNLDLAIEAYREDERWEREHPLEASSVKGKAKQNSLSSTRNARQRLGGFGVVGQPS